MENDESYSDSDSDDTKDTKSMYNVYKTGHYPGKFKQKIESEAARQSTRRVHERSVTDVDANKKDFAPEEQNTALNTNASGLSGQWIVRNSNPSNSLDTEHGYPSDVEPFFSQQLPLDEDQTRQQYQGHGHQQLPTSQAHQQHLLPPNLNMQYQQQRQQAPMMGQYYYSDKRGNVQLFNPYAFYYPFMSPGMFNQNFDSAHYKQLPSFHQNDGTAIRQKPNKNADYNPKQHACQENKRHKDFRKSLSEEHRKSNEHTELRKPPGEEHRRLYNRHHQNSSSHDANASVVKPKKEPFKERRTEKEPLSPLIQQPKYTPHGKPVKPDLRPVEKRMHGERLEVGVVQLHDSIAGSSDEYISLEVGGVQLQDRIAGCSDQDFALEVGGAQLQDSIASSSDQDFTPEVGGARLQDSVAGSSDEYIESKNGQGIYLEKRTAKDCEKEEIQGKQKERGDDDSEEEDYYIYFKGINPKTKNEHLSYFIEATTKGETDPEKIIFSQSRTCALVTLSLKQKPDLSKVEERIRKRGIDGEKPEVYEVQPPDSIAVSSDERIENIEILGLYFESRRVADAELIQDPYESEDGSCFVLQFGDPYVVRKVCARKTPCVLEGRTFRVSPYFECKAGAIWDSELHVMTILGPVVVSLSSSYLALLQRDCCKKLLAKLKDNHCSPEFTDAGLKLKYILRRKTASSRSLLKEWEGATRRIIEDYITENIFERTLQSSDQVWKQLMMFFKSENFEDMAELVASCDYARFSIVLVGLKYQVLDVFTRLGDKQREIEKENRLRRRKTETIRFDSLKFRLLNRVGVFKEVKQKTNDIDIYTGDGEITVEGQAEDISTVHVRLYEAGNRISQSEWKHGFSCDCVDFIKRKLVSNITTILKRNSIIAEWQIDDKVIIVYTFEDQGATASKGAEAEDIGKERQYHSSTYDASTKAKYLLSSIIVEAQENVQDNIIDIIRSPKGISFLESMTNDYENLAEAKFKETRGKVIIYGMKKEAQTLQSKVREFINENATKEVTMKCGTICMEFINMFRKELATTLEKRFVHLKVRIVVTDDSVIIRGTKPGIAETKKELMKVFNSIICEKYTIQKVAMNDVFRNAKAKDVVEKKTKCLIKLPGENATFMLPASADDYSDDSNDGYETPEKVMGATGSSKDVKKIGRRILGVFGVETDDFMAEKGMKKITKLTSFMEVHIYSDSKTNIDNCKKELDAKPEKLCTEIKIVEYKDVIKSLTQEEMKILDIVALANIKIDVQTGIITVDGPVKEVSDVTHQLQAKLLKIERRRHDANAAEELSKLVQWQYEEVTQTEFKRVPYSKALNQLIEKAYQANKRDFEFEDDDGDTFVIDFQQLIEYRKSDDQDKIRVARKDILKCAASALPEEWVPMKDNENIKVVSVPATDQVYKDIKQRFVTEVKTGSYAHRLNVNPNNLQVNKIERIQNKTLFQQYQAKKKQMTQKKPNLPQNMPIEQELWHGTRFNAVTDIEMHGFNKSYSGNPNGDPWYGEGVYFAANASYSARGWLSGAGSGCKGYKFLVKTLTGQFCKGQKGMRYLPPADPKDPTLLYDCAVDNPANPMEFIIFNDTQAYPAYLITFTT